MTATAPVYLPETLDRKALCADWAPADWPCVDLHVDAIPIIAWHVDGDGASPVVCGGGSDPVDGIEWPAGRVFGLGDGEWYGTREEWRVAQVARREHEKRAAAAQAAAAPAAEGPRP